jgi:hypothetical protein
MILFAALALAADAPAADAPAPPAQAAPAAPGTAPVARPGYVPPVVHVSTDPLMPQKYRSVPAGRYECTVDIKVSKEGKPTDVTPTDCDQESFWALATAILEWDFDPATQNGVPVDAVVPYTGVFEVRTLLPRKHVVGFVGLVGSVGGDGWAGVDGRIHLGEQISFSGGVDIDRDTFEADPLRREWAPVFHGDVAFSSRRQSFEHRGIYGMAIGAYLDAWGGSGVYAAFRGEVMTPVPGLSFGGDAGLGTLFSDPPTYDDVGFWQRNGAVPVYPWLRASIIWYAPLPRDQFVVVPRADDPVMYEPIIPEPDPVADVDGSAFAGIQAWHWSQIEPSVGDVTPTGPGFANYPPGTYRCNVRAIISPEGVATTVRVETCPQAARADAEANVRGWRWPERPGEPSVQAVFPAPVFVRREDAEPVRVQSVLLLGPDGKTAPLPNTASTPEVYVHALTPPVWTNENRPTRSCFVDVDITTAGAVQRTRWVSGDIEVQPAVFAALREWRFYPVPVDGGELRDTRVRLSMCDYQ